MSSKISIPSAPSRNQPAYSVPTLSDGANACIAAMDLKDDIEGVIVYYVIASHTKPKEGFCAYISWVAYKVKEAVLSIFGKSQWQTARNFIANRTIEIATQKKILPQNSPKINQRISEQLKKTSQDAAESLLRLAVAFNEDPEKFQRELPNAMKQLALLEPFMPIKIVEKTADALMAAVDKVNHNHSKEKVDNEKPSDAPKFISKQTEANAPTPIVIPYCKGELRSREDFELAEKHLESIEDFQTRFLVFKELADRSLEQAYEFFKKPFTIDTIGPDLQKVKVCCDLCIAISHAALPKSESYQGLPMYCYIHNKIFRDLDKLQNRYLEAIQHLPLEKKSKFAEKLGFILSLKAECQTHRSPLFSKIFPE